MPEIEILITDTCLAALVHAQNLHGYREEWTVKSYLRRSNHNVSGF